MVLLTKAPLLLLLLGGGAVGLKTPDTAVKLSQEDIDFLFGSQEAPPHSIINIHSRSREKRSSNTLTEKPGFLDVTLKDDEDEIEFELRPNYDLVSPDFKLVIRGEDGVIEERGMSGHACYYYGVAKGRPDTAAALSNCDGHGFTGVIVSSNYTHLVRPVKNDTQVKRQRRRRQLSPAGDDDKSDVTGSDTYDEEEDDDITSDGLHVIHTRNKNAKCAVFDLNAMKAPRFIVKLEDVNEKEGEEEHERAKREAATGEKHIETAVFVDDSMYQVIMKNNPGADLAQKVTELVLTIMNGVNIIYNAPSLDIHFTITLVRLDIIKSSSAGPDKANGDIQLYLSNFCTWQKKLNKADTKKGDTLWDHALMMSGDDMWDGNPSLNTVIGLAWVSGMCHPRYSCTINEGTSFESVYVISHEMGHNLGMSHDGAKPDENSCDGNKYLMSAMTGPGKVTWSRCSNKEVKEFFKYLTYDCLVDKARGPRNLHFSKELLPGELYTKEDQCNFAEGATFKPYVTSKYPYNFVCRELWCQNTTHALRTHPALEGTACAVKKFCINGQCVSKPAKATQSKTTATVDTTTKPPNNRKNEARSANNIPTTSSPSGFSGIFRRMKDFFKRYLFLSGGLPRAVFTSQWVLTNLTECTAECGGGWRENLVTCTAAGGAVPLSDEMCDPFSRPPVKASCNTTPCSRPSVPSSSSESGRAINFPSG